MIGQSIENYKIEELLGQGGMGSVYRATDTSLDRAVALKIMNPGVATNADFLRRFKSEARVLGRLQHPNIVNVYTFRHVDSHLIIVMEYVGGGTLSELIDQHGAIPIPQSIDLLKQSLNALDFAHSSNIIHRDIKPPNILLTETYQVKVSDFGLAKIQEDSNATMVTRVGMTGGTLHYMPPEQTEALSNVDHRGDLYSLGMTFYQMLAGRVPFDRNSSAFSILRAIDQQKIPTPDSFNANIPKSLVEIVMKSIKKYPNERFQSAQEMLSAIEHFQSAFGAPQGPKGEYVKTQILSRAPAFNTGSQSQPSRPLFKKNKTKSGHQDKHAVGSRSSSSVKKAKKPSRVSKAGKPTTVTPLTARKRMIPILGIGILLIAGLLIVPRFFSGSSGSDSSLASNPGTTETPSSASGEDIPQNASQSVSQPDEGDGTDTEANEEASASVSPESDVSQENETINTSDPNRPEVEVETVNSPPTAQTRSIEIRSNPSGALVQMNGRSVGRTPLPLNNIQPEVLNVELSLDGYESVRRTMDVSQQTVLEIDMVALSGTVRIRVHPYGDIFVDGEQKASGTNRVHQDELTAGTHTILARHPVLGVWEKRVTIRAGQEEEILFNFDQQFNVTIASQPRNAVIYVDNEPLMNDRGPVTTPRRIQLPPGNHTITVQLQGFRVIDGPRDIVLEENIEDPLIFTLETQ